MRHGNEKEEFKTGAQRDTDKGKGRPSLISPVLIHRLGVLLAEGAKHYGADNWTKGMKYRRTADSMIRHIFQWLAGDEEEDHLAAIAFGVMCLMTYEEAYKSLDYHPAGTGSLDDRDKSMKKILPSILTSAPPDATLKPETKNAAFVTREGKIVEFDSGFETVCSACHNNIMLRGDAMCKACLNKASYIK